MNLALTGRARSNVFNGIKDLGGLVLRGIDSRADIGFLSLFEHYENIAVGSHLKEPRCPIWVVCSESHYTVLFALDDALATAVPPAGRFDLFYYDELARQREEIKLSIDVSKSSMPQKDGDLEPPINGRIVPAWTGVRKVRRTWVLDRRHFSLIGLLCIAIVFAVQNVCARNGARMHASIGMESNPFFEKNSGMQTTLACACAAVPAGTTDIARVAI